MGHLTGKRVYLGGAVEADPNAASWRREATVALLEHGLIILDPLVKPSWMPPVDGARQRELRQLLLDSGERVPSEVVEENSAARKFCLSLVRIADFLIVKIDKTFTVGTFEEIKEANGKPIFIISDEKIPSMWLLDQLNHYLERDRSLYHHSSLEACLGKIALINYVGPDCRLLDPFQWTFLYYK